MKNVKKWMTGGAIALAVAATSVTAFAASSYTTPAEAAAALTGQSVEAVTAERQAGKTYGQIADASGKLAEFEQARLEIYRQQLQTRVDNGTMTQERADELLQAREDRQADCDGTCTGEGGYGSGNHDGTGEGGSYGLGRGDRDGTGEGRGSGRGSGGMGLRDGSCATDE